MLLPVAYAAPDTPTAVNTLFFFFFFTGVVAVTATFPLLEVALGHFTDRHVPPQSSSPPTTFPCYGLIADHNRGPPSERGNDGSGVISDSTTPSDVGYRESQKWMESRRDGSRLKKTQIKFRIIVEHKLSQIFHRRGNILCYRQPFSSLDRRASDVDKGFFSFLSYTSCVSSPSRSRFTHNRFRSRTGYVP